ncbi:Hsp20/alpha crystallin family protein [Natrinema halophilum]|uniref:Hsp20/alpha crystallin family protein n=1 Tax=Natrinema halophilum TaxID=1699371 RepID=A0A7D5K6T5_9EURY|nr:Hsp20/alpha crystallin family protein [Natrinema halophilum]QLG49383.1 Hsp20/alpha crystallin family protein [Natrinema halophilum]
MSTPSPPETASFPFPIQIVYDGPADRLRVVVDVAPADAADLTVQVGSSRIRIAVDCDDDIAERVLTPLPRDLVFGGDREAIYNNRVCTISLETRSRGRHRENGAFRRR